MMFDSIVCVSGSRGSRQIAVTVAACIVDDGTGDPLSQIATATECDNICAYILRDDWHEVEPPRLGDTMRMEDGDTYSVKRVGRLADCFCLSCRRA